MRSRLPFLLVSAFFITMNVLLWRAEFGGHHQFGSAIPAEAVWEKIVTAPDNSLLTIRHHGKKVGNCHWLPSVGQERFTGKTMSEEPPPEGMIERPSGYNIDVNGNIFVDEFSRLRFAVELHLSTNQTWREFNIRLTLRPSVWVWELRAVAATQSLRLRMDDGQEQSEKVFAFSDLQHPDKILKELGGPLLPAILGSMGISTSMPAVGPQRVSLGIEWQSHYDRLKVGGELMRVIRLQTRLFDRFQAAIFVSPVGEILKVELPDQIVLINEALSNLSTEDDRTAARR